MICRTIWTVTVATSGCAATQFIVQSSLSRSVSATCAEALTLDVACAHPVTAFPSGNYFEAEVLEEACTVTCSAALEAWQDSALAACDSGLDLVEMDEDGTSTMPASMIPIIYRYHFNKICLRDTREQWCHRYAYDMSQGNATVADPCEECALLTLQFIAEAPMYGGSLLRDNYTARTSSCSRSDMPLETWTLPYSSTTATPTSTAAPSPSCTGQMYSIQTGDTCLSISESQRVGTAWLLYDNGLTAFCADFPTQGDLCIQSTCETHVVSQNDSCKSLARENFITDVQLYTWNPVLGDNCRHLDRSVGNAICISPPGNSDWVRPTSTGDITTPTATQTAAPVPTNVANGTTENCALFYDVELGDYCNRLVLQFHISLDDFLFLNTGVNENCTNLYAYESYCVQPVGEIDDYPGHPGYIAPFPTGDDGPSYTDLPKATFTLDANETIPTLAPIAPGTRKDCAMYMEGSDLQYEFQEAAYSSLCGLLADSWDITLPELENRNPSLNTSSTECAPEVQYRYCVDILENAVTVEVGTPTPTASPTSTPTPDLLPIRDGAVLGCLEYEAVVSPMTCESVLVENDITIAQFYAWNPAVGSDCTNLWLDYRYCIRGPSSTSTSTTTTSTPSLLPIRDGTTEDCQKYQAVVSPMTCASVLADNDITIAEFYAWNPAVASDCTNLWLDYRYCVQGATTSSTPTATPTLLPIRDGTTADCQEYEAVVSPMTCASVLSENGITIAQFYAWNPAVGSDCTNLWLDYRYCVRGSGTVTTTTTTVSAGPPGPTQPGVAANCNKWHLVSSGDTCANIVSKYGITLAQFYKWNPAIESDCTVGFWADTAYCVGVSA